METEYFNKNFVKIEAISNKTAKEFVIKHHYTHNLNLCKMSYGVFYKNINSVNKFIDDEYKLIGVVVYSHPVGRSAAESFSKIVRKENVLELVRLVILDGYGKNLESWTISQTFDLIKREFPFVKIIMSYSDEEQHHKGIIYQAVGFYYQGNKSIALMPNYSVSLTGPPYKWIHSRTVQSTYGSHNVEYLKKKIGHTFWRKKESSKHRYFYILTNKIEKKKILANLKHPIKPYPKQTRFEEEIEEIKVDSVKENLFFT